jgi:hypothetical protein
MEEKSRQELIQRVRGEEAELLPMSSDDADKKTAKQNAMQQLETMLGRLQERPATGRMVVRISPGSKQWEGSPNDSFELLSFEGYSSRHLPKFV